jgi:hypothetical protein
MAIIGLFIIIKSPKKHKVKASVIVMLLHATVSFGYFLNQETFWGVLWAASSLGQGFMAIQWSIILDQMKNLNMKI